MSHQHIWSSTTISSIGSHPDGTPLAVYRQCTVGRCGYYIVEEGAEELRHNLVETLSLVSKEKRWNY